MAFWLAFVHASLVFIMIHTTCPLQWLFRNWVAGLRVSSHETYGWSTLLAKLLFFLSWGERCSLCTYLQYHGAHQNGWWVGWFGFGPGVWLGGWAEFLLKDSSVSLCTFCECGGVIAMQCSAIRWMDGWKEDDDDGFCIHGWSS